MKILLDICMVVFYYGVAKKDCRWVAVMTFDSKHIGAHALQRWSARATERANEWDAVMGNHGGRQVE